MSDFQNAGKIAQTLYHNMKLNVMSICHEGNIPSICYDRQRQLSKADWWYLVETLEKWHVYCPRAIITKYGALNCWEAMVRTKENRPRIAGAYFTKVVRNLVAV